MAVSGRKLSDFQSSVSLGSTEDFEHSCDPCITIGQQVEAHGFCVECQEYLCKNCFEYHKRTRASRNHQLLDKDSIGKQGVASKDSKECTENCSVHKNEIIKFFCPTHEALGCHDCITLDHRTCKIDYIPDKCTGVGDSKEYRDTVKKLEDNTEEADVIKEKAEMRDKDIDQYHTAIIKDVLKFRKEINDHLDHLQQKFLNEAGEKKSKNKMIIQKVLTECESISSDNKKMQSNLQADKTSQRSGQLYVGMKRVQAKVKSDQLRQAEENLQKTSMEYTFERDTDLGTLLSRLTSFGKLKQTGNLAYKEKNLSHKVDINVRTESDKYACSITGSAVLPSNNIVLADKNNNKLKRVHVQSRSVIEEKLFDDKPCDIAAMPRDQIAVTFPRKKMVLIMATAGRLSAVCMVPVRGECYGVTYSQDKFYLVCENPQCIFVLDTQGNVQNTIALNNDVFQVPSNVAVSQDSRNIYISDYESDCVVSVTLLGDLSAVYKHKDLSGPTGMVVLNDGSLLVCYNNGTIHGLSGDLKQGRTMIRGLHGSRSICVSQHDEEVFIGCSEDQLKVLSMK